VDDIIGFHREERTWLRDLTDAGIQQQAAERNNASENLSTERVREVVERDDDGAELDDAIRCGDETHDASVRVAGGVVVSIQDV